LRDIELEFRNSTFYNYIQHVAISMAPTVILNVSHNIVMSSISLDNFILYSESKNNY